jgi:2,4-dienoyl-CoA reductase-like NADH-dependent reductase (Old Yellow Enzyme family)
MLLSSASAFRLSLRPAEYQPGHYDMTVILSEPLTLPCGAKLTNRIAKGAMSEGVADVENHSTVRLDTLYRRWARSDAGLLFTGNIQVDPNHLERPLNIVIHDDGGKEQLARLASAGKSAGAHFWAQLSHTGRKVFSNINSAPLAPSAVALDMGPIVSFPTPRPMTEDDIGHTINHSPAQQKRRRTLALLVCHYTGRAHT